MCGRFGSKAAEHYFARRNADSRGPSPLPRLSGAPKVNTCRPLTSPGAPSDRVARDFHSETSGRRRQSPEVNATARRDRFPDTGEPPASTASVPTCCIPQTRVPAHASRTQPLRSGHHWSSREPARIPARGTSVASPLAPCPRCKPLLRFVTQQPRVVQPLADLLRGDSPSQRMRRVDEDVVFLGHDRGRHYEKRRGHAGEPFVTQVQ